MLLFLVYSNSRLNKATSEMLWKFFQPDFRAICHEHARVACSFSLFFFFPANICTQNKHKRETVWQISRTFSRVSSRLANLFALPLSRMSKQIRNTLKRWFANAGVFLALLVERWSVFTVSSYFPILSRQLITNLIINFWICLILSAKRECLW